MKSLLAILLFLSFAESKSAKEPIPPLEIEENKRFGFKITAGKLFQSSLIPQAINYRFNRPNTLGFGQELYFGSLARIDLHFMFGTYETSGNPLYCIDCSKKTTYTSESKVFSGGIGYDLLPMIETKRLWMNVSYMSLQYKWSDFTVCLVNSNPFDCNELDFKLVYLGIGSESYPVRGEWFAFGALVMVRLPVWVDLTFDRALVRQTLDDSRVFFPTLDVQIRLKI